MNSRKNWDCLVRISLPPIYVKIFAEVQRCIAAYQERRLPRRLLLSDFAKVVVRDKDWNSIWPIAVVLPMFGKLDILILVLSCRIAQRRSMVERLRQEK